MADTFTRHQVAERADRRRVLVIIDNHVYDLTAFVDEHPGGHEVLVAVSGQDASEEFHDASHTLDAKQLMLKYKIGELVNEDKTKTEKNVSYQQEEADRSSHDSQNFFSTIALPMLLGILLPILYVYLVKG